ncbi:MAG: hypothetical protein V2B19_02645 [Pseudomonadota bacterium]
MDLELFETVPLENGLVLNLYNGSRIIADKLWYVSLTGRVEIPVAEAPDGDPGLDAPDFDAVKSALGNSIVFEKKMERNFISENNKNEVLKGVRDYFMDSIVQYLSHPAFPRQYILKCYREYLKKEKLQAARVAFSGELKRVGGEDE